MSTDKGKAKSQHFSGKEHCVLCGRLTEEAKELTLSERKHYIEGAGQLCQECYQEIYMPRNNENMLRFVGWHIPGNWFP